MDRLRALVPRCLLAALAVGLWLAASGCQPLSLRGPVPRSVATARQLTQQGSLAMERGDWTRSESLLSQAVKSCPVDADARRRYAEVLWRRGAVDEALVQIGEARRLAPDDVEIVVLDGQWRLVLGQVDRAAAAAQAALACDPRSAAAWALAGRAAHARADLRGALAAYQRSLSYAPGKPDVLLQVADVYRLLNEPERALLALQSLCDAYPPGEEPQNVLYQQGLALAALGRHRDAAEVLTLCLGRGKPTPEVLGRLAECQWKLGRPGDAERLLQQALALNPNHPASKSLLGQVRLAAGESDAPRR
jgi:tetratricopeptide (TPR) repeat protein